jgi:hypothetical protein
VATRSGSVLTRSGSVDAVCGWRRRSAAADEGEEAVGTANAAGRHQATVPTSTMGRVAAAPSATTDAAAGALADSTP